ncbi:MAG: type II toxin-antitoxin system YafQ family toxin [Holophagaceae bacterium]|nr:type II toxin-antitoxin system YafQ family toxin [Holophagaceae bacterium]
MYSVKPAGKFPKDIRRAERRRWDMALLKGIVEALVAGKALDTKYLDHPLQGEYKGCRECHVTPDWLLIYKFSKVRPVIYLLRTGRHSDLF